MRGRARLWRIRSSDGPIVDGLKLLLEGAEELAGEGIGQGDSVCPNRVGRDRGPGKEIIGGFQAIEMLGIAMQGEFEGIPYFQSRVGGLALEGLGDAGLGPEHGGDDSGCVGRECSRGRDAQFQNLKGARRGLVKRGEEVAGGGMGEGEEIIG